MKIYGDIASGNCLKVKYTADHLQLAYTWVPVDIMRGESRTPEFLARNPQGQIPTIELEDGRYLAQSNAIIRYLAKGTALVPRDAYSEAKVDELLCWEQYSHEPYIAVCRFQMLFHGRPKEAREAWRVERGEKALDSMDSLLAGRRWLVGDEMSIADISLVAYTRLSHEGGFDLSRRSHVKRWVIRCEEKLSLDS